jgi:phosphoglycolate phosphatase-like HAD superfamily hydrolase
MGTSMVDAVIFDLDGTLVDTNDAHVQAWYSAFRDLGYDVPRSRIVREIGKGGDKLVPSILGEEGEARDGEALRAAHGVHFLTIAKKEKFRVFPGTEALMGELRRRGIATAVATSSKKEQLDAVAASSGLDVTPLVDAVVTGSDASESKPAPDLVHAALAKLGSDPRRSVMVGDTPYDGQACARAGVPFLGLLCGGRPPELLIEAGARGLYADPADLLLQLDEALRLQGAATT